MIIFFIQFLKRKEHLLSHTTAGDINVTQYKNLSPSDWNFWPTGWQAFPSVQRKIG